MEYVEDAIGNPPVLRNISTSFGSDDNLAMLNGFLLAHLDHFEGSPDPRIQDACKRSVTNRWRWAASPENALFSFIYHGMTEKLGDEGLQSAIDTMESFLIDKTVNLVALKAKNPRNPATWENSIERRAIPGIMQFTGIDYILAYAIGRYYKILR